MRLVLIKPMKYFEKNAYVQGTYDYWPSREDYLKFANSSINDSGEDFDWYINRRDVGKIIDLDNYGGKEHNRDWAVEKYITREENPEYFL